MRKRGMLVFLGLGVVWLGCGSGGAAGTGAAGSDGGGGGGGGGSSTTTTPPPDGASGVCCPVSTGGCASAGGYAADGTSCGPQLCDGMCDQKIVTGDHGCPTLTYTPCETQGGSVFDGGGDVQCTYPTVDNDPRCPGHYSYSYGGQPCPQIGLTCSYPGAGDGTSNGCFATAMLFCRGDAGAGDAGGPGTWTAAQ